MGFLRKAASIGTFGLAGLALGNKKKKSKDTPQQTPSLITQQPSPSPSLVNDRTVY